ncbi:GatB/YqeY domain-containing protein [Patescibacteria group bacterium]|nr:GatB/YqeY domain-containing protein [Patescibacteria group bacterium]
MALKEKIQAEVKKAMLDRNALEVSTLRMLLAAVLNKEKEKRAKLSKEAPIQDRDPDQSVGKKYLEKLEQLSKLNDDEVLEVISSEVKKRKDSIEQFGQAGRNDLVEKEKKELEMLMKYMPEQMPEDEIRKIVKEKIQELGLGGKNEIGKLMGAIMPQLKGKTDGSLVSKIVSEELK